MGGIPGAGRGPKISLYEEETDGVPLLSTEGAATHSNELFPIVECFPHCSLNFSINDPIDNRSICDDSMRGAKTGGGCICGGGMAAIMGGIPGIP